MYSNFKNSDSYFYHFLAYCLQVAISSENVAWTWKWASSTRTLKNLIFIGSFLFAQWEKWPRGGATYGKTGLSFLIRLESLLEKKKEKFLVQNDLLDNLQKVDVEIVHEVLSGDKTTFEASFEWKNLILISRNFRSNFDLEPKTELVKMLPCFPSFDFFISLKSSAYSPAK